MYIFLVELLSWHLCRLLHLMFSFNWWVLKIYRNIFRGHFGESDCIPYSTRMDPRQVHPKLFPLLRSSPWSGNRLFMNFHEVQLHVSGAILFPLAIFRLKVTNATAPAAYSLFRYRAVWWTSVPQNFHCSRGGTRVKQLDFHDYAPWLVKNNANLTRCSRDLSKSLQWMTSFITLMLTMLPSKVS